MKNKMFIFIMAFVFAFSGIVAPVTAFAYETSYTSYYDEYLPRCIYNADERELVLTYNDAEGSLCNVYQTLDDVTAERLSAGYELMVLENVTSKHSTMDYGFVSIWLVTYPENSFMAWDTYNDYFWLYTNGERVVASEIDVKVVKYEVRLADEGSSATTAFTNIAEKTLGSANGKKVFNDNKMATYDNYYSKVTEYCSTDIYTVDENGVLSVRYYSDDVTNTDYDGVSGIVKSSVAFMYQDADTSSRMILALTESKEVLVSQICITDEGIMYLCIYTDNGTVYKGFMKESDLTVEALEDDSSQVTSLQGVIVGGIAAVFDEPCVKENAIGYIASGDSVVVEGSCITGTDGGLYYYVYYNHNYDLCRGYVQAEYVSFNIGDAGGSSGSNGGNIEWADGSGWTDISADNIKDKAEELKGGVGEILSFVISVPVIIANLFSFLPDWCLTILGISFSLAGILIVIKLIRG